MNGYGIFLMVELARLNGIIDAELEYDLTWEHGTCLYSEFEASKFNTDNIPLYDAIINYLLDKVNK